MDPIQTTPDAAVIAPISSPMNVIPPLVPTNPPVSLSGSAPTVSVQPEKIGIGQLLAPVTTAKAQKVEAVRESILDHKTLIISMVTLGALMINGILSKHGVDFDVTPTFISIATVIVYLLTQHAITMTQSADVFGKAWWKSKKFYSVIIAILAPISLTMLKIKTGFEVDPNLVYGILGVNGTYLVTQTGFDLQDPDSH